jgi:hypothetical protein
MEHKIQASPQTCTHFRGASAPRLSKTTRQRGFDALP